MIPSFVVIGICIMLQMLIVAWRWWIKWTRQQSPMATACQLHSSACWMSSRASRTSCSLLLTLTQHQLPDRMCRHLHSRLRPSVHQTVVCHFVIVNAEYCYLHQRAGMGKQQPICYDPVGRWIKDCARSFVGGHCCVFPWVSDTVAWVTGMTSAHWSPCHLSPNVFF